MPCDFDVTIHDSYSRKKVKENAAPSKMIPVDHFLNAITGSGLVECRMPLNTLEMHHNNKGSLFFHAVHACFANHYPLALSPEVLMYLVLHEVAVTVKQNPDEYRDLFTTSAEKEIIRVRHDGLVPGHSDTAWLDVLPMFETEMGKLVPSTVLTNALPSFSTHTPVSRAASMVAFMDAASPYYDYRVMTCCGIPRIRLLGQPEDYVKLLNSCIALAPMFPKHLGEYFNHLIPVLYTIAAQANGAPFDNDFWSSIYKHLSGSGTDDMTGWITAFLNYTLKDDNKFIPKDAKLYDWEKGLTRYSGYDCTAVPSHLSRVNFTWEYLGGEMPMEFIGGILAITKVDSFVTPTMGFAVKRRKA